VRLDEPACPFCRGELPASFREQKPLSAAARKLNRAALYALRVGAASATAVATAACSSGTSGGGTDSGPLVDATGDVQDDAPQAVAAYGGFVTPDAAVDAAADATDDAPHVIALYGGFVGVDAAYGGFVVTDGGPDGDASVEDGSADAEGG
jgi:hypothetical protein